MRLGLIFDFLVGSFPFKRVIGKFLPQLVVVFCIYLGSPSRYILQNVIFQENGLYIYVYISIHVYMKMYIYVYTYIVTGR